MVNLFNLSERTRSLTLKVPDTTGCFRELFCRTFVHISDWRLSISAATSPPSPSLVKTVHNTCFFFAARRPKKSSYLLCTQNLIRPSGLNLRTPPMSFTKAIAFETSWGSLLRPVSSPLLNPSVRNCFCLSVKRTFLFIIFKVHPIGSGGYSVATAD